jgi:ATP-independent RNA helicase DbpA
MLAEQVQRHPETIEIDSVDALPAIEQQFFEVSRHGKIALPGGVERIADRLAIALGIAEHHAGRRLMLAEQTLELCDALNAAGQSALSLHGDLEQRDRDQTLVRFANGYGRCGAHALPDPRPARSSPPAREI